MRVKTLVVLLGLGALAATGSMVGCGGEETDSTGSGTPPGSPCSPKDPVCQPGLSDCVALVDNAGKDTFGLRMSQITITKPAVLAQGLVGSIIKKGLTINLEQCNLAGDGTFSWLLEFDTAAKTLKTGGAKPVDDPTAGYCFVNEALGGLDIAPITVELDLADGSFDAVGEADIVVPIFLDAAASSWVLLPLNKARIFDGTLSENNNCIGSFNDELLDPLNNCQGDSSVEGFENAGQLEGYITVEQADSVVVEQLSQSLCVLLSGDPSAYGDGGDPEKCKRDAEGNITLEGDWCAATNAAATADCKDAFQLGAAFAASAVDISGDCN